MTGQPTAADLPARIAAKVVITESGCWEWTGFRARNGYGRVSWQGRMTLAHCLTYRLIVGEPAPGLQLDHLCRLRHCVNPQHLEPVSQRENILRGESPSALAARRDECPQGHPYSGDNLAVTRAGTRKCRTCDRARIAQPTPCPVCQKSIRRHGIAEHVRKMHGKEAV